MERCFIWTCLGGIIFIVTTNEASIAGVTYMDNFDFEERYRDVNECNPFYWHPLHLPEKCLQMFEHIMRTGPNSFAPYRVVKAKPKRVEHLYPNLYYYDVPDHETEYVESIEPDYMEPENMASTRYMSPFETLFEFLSRDIREHPSEGKLELSPYFGVIAKYKQPVSYQSAAMIKKFARAYASLYTSTSLPDSSTTAKNHEEQGDKVDEEPKKQMTVNKNNGTIEVRMKMKKKKKKKYK